MIRAVKMNESFPRSETFRDFPPEDGSASCFHGHQMVWDAQQPNLLQSSGRLECLAPRPAQTPATCVRQVKRFSVEYFAPRPGLAHVTWG